MIWVVTVTGLTILTSLGLAQFMAKEFFGRRVLRWAVIVPWAASLVITARLFTLILDYNHGILNRLLIGLHLISRPVDFLGDDRFTLASMIGVGLFVSIPFTAYVFLAGLNAIPHDVYEAARIDGAGAWGTYVRITLPLLRGPMLIAIVLNMIYVFNSFPIVYTLDDRNPGFSHDTTITYTYKLAFKSAEHSVGMSAAAGVLQRRPDPAGRAGLPAVGRLEGPGALHDHAVDPAGAHPAGRSAERAGRPAAPGQLGPGAARRAPGDRPADRPGVRVALSGDAARRPAAQQRRAGLSRRRSCPGTGACPASATSSARPDSATGCRPRSWSSVSSTLLVLVAAMPAAYFTARFRFPGRGLFLLLVLATQMFSPTSLVVGIYREAFELNLVNTYLALIITNSAFNLAFAVWMLQGFMSSVPRGGRGGRPSRRLQPARDAAAGHPAAGQARPGHGHDLHLHRGLERVRRRADPDAGRREEAADGRHQLLRHRLLAALGPALRGALIAIVPVVVLFGLIEKHLVSGLTAGSVK